jgi:hypothetical protein
MGVIGGDSNGTVIADLCYRDGERFRKIGALIYYRSHDAEVRLDIIPAGLWSSGESWFFGNFKEHEKVPEPPFIEGNIVAATQERGKPVTVGHIHTYEDDHGGDRVQYRMELFGIPVGQWRRAIESDKGDGDKRSLFMRVEMEDK